MTAVFSWVGRFLFDLFEEVGELAFLVRSSARWAVRSPIEWRQTLVQMQRIGVESLPVSAMTSFFTGMVLALQSGATSKHFFNEPLFVGTVVSFAVVMELSPVMTSLVVSGRAGAAIAAELGTMKVTEQIDALYTLGTDPVRYLVIPRVLAFVLVLPFLVVISDFTGVLGGFVVASVKLRVAANVYWHDIIDNMRVRHFVHGYIKAYVFALVIAFICCYKGITTRDGAEGVGKSTTTAVVLSMVSVLVLDYFVTAVLVALGIT
ncbi:MAG: ABC transporter permease [Elusimicrobia bacterium]|nr:ABC transporter permease [Elusimicrobiota bacterium]MDE2424566.1 ABC transporter permease [Elusimicrobiota bacterium]